MAISVRSFPFLLVLPGRSPERGYSLPSESEDGRGFFRMDGKTGATQMPTRASALTATLETARVEWVFPRGTS